MASCHLSRDRIDDDGIDVAHIRFDGQVIAPCHEVFLFGPQSVRFPVPDEFHQAAIACGSAVPKQLR